MKKVLIGLGAVFSLLILTVLVGPALMDWNAYKAEIANKIAAETGRQLSLDGDIALKLVPQPTFTIGEVRFANMPGAANPDMVSLDGLNVRVALGPLLGGRVQIQSVTLLNPEIRLERSADGVANWEFAPQGGGAATASAESNPGSGDSAGGDSTVGTSSSGASSSGSSASSAAPDITVENFLIENGRVTFEDISAGTAIAIENINARFAAADITGPYESGGSLVYRGIELGYDVNVAEIIEDRTVPLGATIRVGSDAQFRFDGGVVNLRSSPKLRGQVKGDGQDLRNLIAGLGGPAGLPPVLGQVFGLQGTIEAGASGGKAEDLVLNVGNTQINVSAEAQTGDITTARLNVAAGTFDLDQWLARDPQAKSIAAANDASGTPGELSKSDEGASVVEPSAAPGGSPTETDLSFNLPKDVQATIAVSVDAVAYQGGVVQDAVLNLELANGELALNQLTAQLPGKTDVGVFGFLTTPDAKPVFDGNLELASANLRSVLDWLDVSVPDYLPADRLRTLAVKTDIVANSEFVQLPGLSVSADGSNLTGGITIALRRRPSFGADLRIDALNIDPYLPPDKARASVATTEAQSNVGNPQQTDGEAKPTQSSQPTQKSKTPNPFAALAVLDRFDANLKVAIGRFTSQGTEARNLAADVTLFNGNLDIKSAQVGDMAGATASVTGKLNDLNGVPKAEGLAVRIRAKDVSGVVAMTGLSLPVSPQALGNTSIDLNVNGSLLAPTIALAAKTAGGSLTSGGKLSVLDLATGGIRQDITFEHPNLAALAARLGVAYSPSGDIGGVSLKATVAGGPTSLTTENLTGSLNGTAFKGKAQADLERDVPFITADLDLGAFNITPFLPADKRTGLNSFKRLPTSFRGGAGNANTSLSNTGGLVVPVLLDPRWSQDPIDVSALKAIDGVFTLKSPQLRYGFWEFQDADMATTLKNGTATIDRLTGSILGGQVSMTANLTPGLDVKAQGDVSALNLGLVTQLLGTERARGLLTAGFNLSARGRSQADLVSSLVGSLTATGRGLDLEDISSFGPGAPLMGLVSIMNQFGGVLGGSTKQGFADLTAEIDLAGGVATPRLLQVVSNLGVAKAEGSIDLAAWRMNISGAIEPSPNILTAVLGGGTQPKLIPFAIEGLLDKPRVKLDTKGLGQGGIALPGVDRLLGNSGAARLLQGILGGGAQTTQQPQVQQVAPSTTQPPSQIPSQPSSQGATPPAQVEPTPAPQQPVSPQDVLRGILQGLGGS